MLEWSFLRTGRFWSIFLVTLLITGVFFAWELNLLAPLGWSGPPRVQASSRELLMTGLIALLIALNAGLYSWQRAYGTCPRGTKRATGIAGLIGGIALICPACIALPIGLTGLSVALLTLAPYIPLLQTIAIVLLCASLSLLVPKRTGV